MIFCAVLEGHDADQKRCESDVVEFVMSSLDLLGDLLVDLVDEGRHVLMI